MLAAILAATLGVMLAATVVAHAAVGQGAAPAARSAMPAWARLNTTPITPLPSFGPGSAPTGLIYGPQGAFWSTLRGANAVGSLAVTHPLTAALVVTTPLSAPAAYPHDLLIGADQAIWLTERSADALERLDPISRTLTSFPLDLPGAAPTELALGQDGALWFTQLDGNRIGRLSLAAQPTGSLAPDGFSHIPIAAPKSKPLGIATALDGSVWFTEWGSRKVGRVTSADILSEYPIPNQSLRPTEITLGPDGNLWFVHELGRELVRLNPETAEMMTYTLPTVSNAILDLATGPDGRLWFLGVQSIGGITITLDGPSGMDETTFAPIFQGQGRSQLIAGPGNEMHFIRLDSPSIHRAVLPDAAAWRDLQTFITHLPPNVLAGGEFKVGVDLVNWSVDAATPATATLTLDQGLSFVSASPAMACQVDALTVNCPLGALAGLTTQPVTFTLAMGPISDEETGRGLVVEVHSAQGDYQAANNIVRRDFRVLRSLKYFNDFEIGSDVYWSENLTRTLPGGGHVLGDFDDSLVTLSFHNLPPHDSARLCFDLYTLGAWDGSAVTEPGSPASPAPVIGPDLWSGYLDENPLLITTFSNRSGLAQAFPASYPSAGKPPQTSADATGEFGGGGERLSDARYRLCFERLHVQFDLVATFYGNNLSLPEGERWALDNVALEVFYRHAFQYTFMPFVRR